MPSSGTLKSSPETRYLQDFCDNSHTGIRARPTPVVLYVGKGGSWLLAELSADEKQAAARVLGRCTTVDLPVDVPHGCDDLPAATVFLVEDGVVLLSSGTRKRRLVVAVGSPGCVLVPPARDEDVTAVSDTRLTVVRRDEHEELLRVPGAARAVTSGLIAALSDREDSLANFARFPHVERVRAKLLQLACLHGKVSKAGVVIDIPLTHDLLAEMIGSARETVTRALRELARTGFVTRENGVYRLNVGAGDLAALRRSA